MCKQVKAMNAAINVLGDSDEGEAESRRFLSETGVNFTADPSDIGRAGQQVSPGVQTPLRLNFCVPPRHWSGQYCCMAPSITNLTADTSAWDRMHMLLYKR